MNPLNPIRTRLATGMQWTGLVVAALGLLAVPLFLGLALQWLIGGATAVGLDIVAIRSESDVRAMLAALLKLVVLVAALMLFTNAGSIPGAAAGAIPPDTGPVLLLISILPTEIGAMLRRTGPMPEMGVPPELQS